MPVDRASRDRNKEALVLLLIRAAAADPLPTRITDQEIDEIMDRLDKLHILELVTERAFQRRKTAKVNNTVKGYASYEEDHTTDEDSIFKVNYRGFQDERQTLKMTRLTNSAGTFKLET